MSETTSSTNEAESTNHSQTIKSWADNRLSQSKSTGQTHDHKMPNGLLAWQFLIVHKVNTEQKFTKKKRLQGSVLGLAIFLSLFNVILCLSPLVKAFSELRGSSTIGSIDYLLAAGPLCFLELFYTWLIIAPALAGKIPPFAKICQIVGNIPSRLWNRLQNPHQSNNHNKRPMNLKSCWMLIQVLVGAFGNTAIQVLYAKQLLSQYHSANFLTMLLISILAAAFNMSMTWLSLHSSSQHQKLCRHFRLPSTDRLHMLLLALHQQFDRFSKILHNKNTNRPLAFDQALQAAQSATTDWLNPTDDWAEKLPNPAWPYRHFWLIQISLLCINIYLVNALGWLLPKDAGWITHLIVIVLLGLPSAWVFSGIFGGFIYGASLSVPSSMSLSNWWQGLKIYWDQSNRKMKVIRTAVLFLLIGLFAVGSAYLSAYVAYDQVNKFGLHLGSFPISHVLGSIDAVLVIVLYSIQFILQSNPEVIALFYSKGAYAWKHKYNNIMQDLMLEWASIPPALKSYLNDQQQLQVLDHLNTAASVHAKQDTSTSQAWQQLSDQEKNYFVTLWQSYAMSS